jgi:rubrerythrin
MGGSGAEILGSTVEHLDPSDYVQFLAAGQAAVGEFHCSECGYGIVISRRLPSCPMCGGRSWEQSTLRPPLQ